MTADNDLTTEYFPADVAARYRAAGYWTDDTFADFLPAAAARFGDAEALVGRDHRGAAARLTYREIDRAASAVASGLRARGLGPGDRVVVQLPNIVEFVPLLFGVFRIGAIPVFALPAHRRSELVHFIETSGAKALITAGRAAGFDHRDLARDVLAELDGPGPLVIVADDEPAEFVGLADLLEGGRDADGAPAAVAAGALAFLQLSGGTTGVPKLIPRTHADYLYSVRESAKICGLGPDTRFLVVLPVAHNFPMSSPGILGVLWAGGTVVLGSDPAPYRALPLIEAERITMTSLVPPVAMLWLQARPTTDADLSSLQVLQVGGAKFPVEAARRVQPELGCRLQQVFGMAEGLVNYTRDDDPDDLVLGTQGRPISPDDEVRVVDDDGAPVPAGAAGHLLTRGPYTIRGYLGGVDAASFDAEGFYRTGDIVRRLPSGHLVVEGRAKDQINRGGEKIAAEEVENHLVAHPAVIDAAVVAVADEFLGERTCAVILGAPGEDRPTVPQLKKFVRERGVAAYKVPDRIEFVDAFPTTGVGKISRRELRRALADLVAARTDTEEKK
ncbi:AMP-dependent synthetase and ligase OS=Tsukamurella paurometabola (strain ATCC 8368 / DSM /CCUG 35730 / CIP 100753 / JCM 10117 / KCTC 9821 / NBRC 16120/ NCIMB 702349 / NCTC 13040) OX=521096 GN=Tpau_3685 PE=4 SV=1 [Tsukamurella paurometabola]|uniref:AMP-dependent synthetase and ligase n=1 Tax=Tsukamurella paurometabola (strain ATCC 8368 / DSM 20162 / CCUG 35730 / CIP 100753 / JCM 10117 / KCTC 9821 / NBRC 16120 / NCIMB 702349 / NCTC 13040) TaxID=521096 RepID=D5UY26_TSUPD|nr:AMP-binding protein [Tsukamurella paurometabola]ADG80263.1 AMP-dependent synthetase and ligase [Tsukamurella paurometabola DSM 20162]SUP39056.1 2,3-dihydroxybenzoate-AMP ligase [Tsukamurella paurometabola]